MTIKDGLLKFRHKQVRNDEHIVIHCPQAMARVESTNFEKQNTILTVLRQYPESGNNIKNHRKQEKQWGKKAQLNYTFKLAEITKSVEKNFLQCSNIHLLKRENGITKQLRASLQGKAVVCSGCTVSRRYYSIQK